MDEMFLRAFWDAVFDSLKIVPFLFIIFVLIEIFEHFYSGKILSFAKLSSGFKTKAGPLIGAVLASIPQCGLSVVASAIYAKKLITRGTLIAVYIATSDEAVPVLISNPGGAGAVLPLIFAKIAAGVLAGYLTDIMFKPKETLKMASIEDIQLEKGCHSHDISKENIDGCMEEAKKGMGSLISKIKVLILHPFIHTLSVTFFVFIVTFLINILFFTAEAKGLNFGLFAFGAGDTGFIKGVKEVVQIILSAVFGIIPNCAVSVGITIMYLKGAISFASCVSGLSAGAGLGILVLIKKNEDKKDTIFIIWLLLILSILAGISLLATKIVFGF